MARTSMQWNTNRGTDPSPGHFVRHRIRSTRYVRFSIVLLVICLLGRLSVASSYHSGRRRPVVGQGKNVRRYPRKNASDPWMLSSSEEGAVTDLDSRERSLQEYERRIITERIGFMNTVRVVAFLNLLVYTLRPDHYIPWMIRLPRALWEFSVFSVASFVIASLKHQEYQTYYYATPSSPSSSLASTWYLVLSLMTISTALVDIFFWSPIFAFATSFESCNGGWPTLFMESYHCESNYVVGIGRLVTSMQCLFGGLFYLVTAVVSVREAFSMPTRSYHSMQAPQPPT